MQRATSKGFRLSIGLFGRQNVGKSSLLNAITPQSVSAISEVAFPATDPAEKLMELPPLGQVQFVDTAGVEDTAALGAQRIEKTRQAITRSDIGILVAEAGVWGEFEERVLHELRTNRVPVVVALNKADIRHADAELLSRLASEQIPFAELSATTSEGVDVLQSKLAQVAPAEAPLPMLSDLIHAGETAVLVMPIDKEAPKDPIHQLEAQTIHELLDDDASCLMVKEGGLKNALKSLGKPPSIVVTDAQAFGRAAGATPMTVPLTAFSILFSRVKGDLIEQSRAVATMTTLRPGDRILIAESCTHHPPEDDTARVKIPRWIEKKVGGKLNFTTVQGRDFPLDLSPYKLVIHCGACMWNRREMMARIAECKRQGVPITNYGLVIAYCQGILERALEPFPLALAAYRAELRWHRRFPEVDSLSHFIEHSEALAM